MMQMADTQHEEQNNQSPGSYHLLLFGEITDVVLLCRCCCCFASHALNHAIGSVQGIILIIVLGIHQADPFSGSLVVAVMFTLLMLLHDHLCACVRFPR